MTKLIEVFRKFHAEYKAMEDSRGEPSSLPLVGRLVNPRLKKAPKLGLDENKITSDDDIKYILLPKLLNDPEVQSSNDLKNLVNLAVLCALPIITDDEPTKKARLVQAIYDQKKNFNYLTRDSFPKSLEEAADCVDPDRSKTAVAETKLAPVIIPPTSELLLLIENERLKQENEKLQKENATAKSYLSETLDENETLKKENATAKEYLNETLDKNEELLDASARVTTETFVRHHDELDKEQKQHASTREELQKAKEEIAQLKTEREAAITNARREIATAVDEVKQISEIVKAQQIAEQLRFEAAQREAAEKLAAADAEYRKAIEQRDLALDKVEALNYEVTRVRLELDGKDRHIEELNVHIDALRDVNREAEEQHAREKGNLETQLTKTAQDSADARTEVSHQKSIITDLEARLATSAIMEDNLNKQKRVLQSKLRVTEDQVNNLTKKAKEISKRLESRTEQIRNLASTTKRPSELTVHAMFATSPTERRIPAASATRGEQKTQGDPAVVSRVARRPGSWKFE